MGYVLRPGTVTIRHEGRTCVLTVSKCYERGCWSRGLERCNNSVLFSGFMDRRWYPEVTHLVTRGT